VQVFKQYLPSLHVIKAFPFVRLLHHLPRWLTHRISRSIAMGHELEQFAARRIDEFIAQKEAGELPPFPTIMERLLIPIPERGYMVPDKQGLRDEILTTISAGDDTTGIANMVTLYNIVSNPAIHSRLLAELKTVLPALNSHAPYPELEKLPYLVCSTWRPMTAA
jgi:cytochrome P450